MAFVLQRILENEKVKLVPLQPDDFEKLYVLAADPLIWLQHPNKNRYKRKEFANYFEGAVLSQGAFLIIDKQTGEIAGCTRFYEYDEKEKSVSIGYTFLTVNSWGKGVNPAAKQLMIDYALEHVDKIHFHIGSGNRRSQIAIERLGAQKIDEKEMKYHGEDEHLGFIYQITKKSHEDFLIAKEEERKRKTDQEHF